MTHRFNLVTTREFGLNCQYQVNGSNSFFRRKIWSYVLPLTAFANVVLPLKTVFTHLSYAGSFTAASLLTRDIKLLSYAAREIISIPFEILALSILGVVSLYSADSAHKISQRVAPNPWEESNGLPVISSKQKTAFYIINSLIFAITMPVLLPINILHCVVQMKPDLFEKNIDNPPFIFYFPLHLLLGIFREKSRDNIVEFTFKIEKENHSIAKHDDVDAKQMDIITIENFDNPDSGVYEPEEPYLSPEETQQRNEDLEWAITQCLINPK